MSALREFDKVPVWIVENHNEVLEPIYRAIASRHLPFEELAMLHFDSHPDLQIDTHMSADTVFDKQLLLDTLSIENWIMPAIYAGHFSHVTWVKPPWADQLPEGSRKIKVGKERMSGKLRVNWPDSYFLSDLLFASDEQMDNIKDAMVDVVTMETPCLKTGDYSMNVEACIKIQSKANMEEISSRQPSCRPDGLGGCVGLQGRTSPADDIRLLTNVCGDAIELNEDAGGSKRLRSSSEQVNRHEENNHPLPSNGQCQPSIQCAELYTTMDGKDVKLGQRSHLNSSHSENHVMVKRFHECANSDVANFRRTDNQEQAIDKSRSIPSQCDKTSDAQQLQNNSQNDGNSGIRSRTDNDGSVANPENGRDRNQGLRTSYSATKDALVQVFSDFGKRFILDIDLDFFSTRNPFRQMYTEEQYNMMNDLYRFAAPLDESSQALDACQKRRAQQISELSVCIKAAFSGGRYDASLGVQEHRFLKVCELVKSLQSTPDIEEECLDPEMVHMAGLTCDDHGELPHHVSTDQEIESLISQMSELLAEMPTPTMITISRSSHDDYCPAHQVDGIQNKVLRMLQSLYNKLDIHLEYELT